MPSHDHDNLRSEEPFIADDNALFAAMVHSASDPIIGMDVHGTVLSWNEAAVRLFGHTARDMIGHPVNRIIPYDRRREQDGLLASIRAGTPVNGAETLLMTAPGDEVAVTMTASPVRNNAGAIIAASLIIREPAASKAGMDASRSGAAIDETEDRQSILVVEDEALIGLGLAAMLENAGFEVIGPVGDVVSATALLNRHDCALAILDINLRRGETSAPLAQRLKADGIPFFVTSGYLEDNQPAIFGEVPSFSKPVRAHSLVAAVQEVLG